MVLPRPGTAEVKYTSALLFLPRRLSCAACGEHRSWRPGMEGAGLRGVTPGGTEDPFFGEPLWLQTRCVGRILWAYNEAHIDELAAFVGARLRERGPTPTLAMVSRLPLWMKRADNRDEVLAGLDHLRDLAAPGRDRPADRSDAGHDHATRPRPHLSLLFRGGAYPADPADLAE